MWLMLIFLSAYSIIYYLSIYLFIIIIYLSENIMAQYSQTLQYTVLLYSFLLWKKTKLFDYQVNHKFCLPYVPVCSLMMWHWI